MRMKKMRSHCAFAILVLSSVIVAAQKSTPGRDVSVYAELAKAPAKAAARHNPLEADPDAVAAGGKLFASLRVEQVQQATPGAIFWLLTNGVVRRGMPVWSKLPEPQRWQLVSYIKSLTPASHPIPKDGKTPHP